MTATTMSPTSTSTSRVLAVARLHFVNRWTVLYVPWMILGFIFLVNLAVWWIIFSSVDSSSDRADVRDGLSYSGASFFIFVYMLIVAIQAMNATFPFAQGYSVTRRDYYLGTSIAFVLLSAIYAAGLTLMSVIEDVTGGWGFGGRMFTAVYFGDGGPLERLLFFLFAFLFFFFVGAATATVYVRWKSNGVLAFFAILGLAVVGGIALVTTTDRWPTIWSWFGSTGPLGIAAWSLVVTAIAGVAGYFILRRATPTNS